MQADAAGPCGIFCSSVKEAPDTNSNGQPVLRCRLWGRGGGAVTGASGKRTPEVLSGEALRGWGVGGLQEVLSQRSLFRFPAGEEECNSS